MALDFELRGRRQARVMARQCTVCRKSYPSQANYCAVCGRPLVADGITPSSRNARLAMAVVISALITYAVFAVARPEVEIEGRFFDLPLAKAAAVFKLLEPRNVKVLVSKDGGRIQINGTGRECDVLADFVGLIGRFGGQPDCEIQRGMEHARKSWTTRQTYKLPKSKAKALFDALAPDDVPVLVSLRGRRLQIDASPTDQATLKHLVEILRGRRL